MEQLKEQFHEFISGLMSLPVKIHGSHLYRSLEAKKKMVRMLCKIIQSKKNSGIPTIPRDVMDALLLDTSGQLTDTLITDNMIDNMMIPGEESVPFLMTLAIKYISDCPTALQQLKEENMKLKRLKEQKGKTLSWNDYLSLPFTKCKH